MATILGRTFRKPTTVPALTRRQRLAAYIGGGFGLLGLGAAAYGLIKRNRNN